VLLSHRARADLEDIRRYTLKTWGRAQWLVYYRHLVDAFRRIEENPEQGRDRSLFVRGMRSIQCQRHLIFYKQAAAAHHRTVVLRIIHQQRNLPALMYYDDLDGLS